MNLYKDKRNIKFWKVFYIEFFMISFLNLVGFTNTISPSSMVVMLKSIGIVVNILKIPFFDVFTRKKLVILTYIYSPSIASKPTTRIRNLI